MAFPPTAAGIRQLVAAYNRRTERNDQWLESTISKRQMELLRLPEEWIVQGQDGFEPETLIDIVLARGCASADRIGCYLTPIPLRSRIATVRLTTQAFSTSRVVHLATVAFARNIG